MYRQPLILLLLAICMVFVGCQSVPGGMTSSTLPITAKDAYTEIGPAVGRCKAIGILGLVFSWNYSAWHAIQNAKKASGADGLINVTADNLTVLPGFYVSFHTITVRGTAVKFRRGEGAE